MPSLARQYTDELHEKFSYWAAWLPSSQVALGDSGPVEHGVFKPETTLERLGIAFDTIRGNQRLDLDHRSRDGVKYSTQAAAGGQVIPEIPQGSAGIEVSFERDNAVLFVMRGGYEERVADIRELKDALLPRVLSGDLPRDYAVVTHVVHAESATVLIAGSRAARLAASAEADLQAGLLDLANASLGLSLVASANLHTELLARNDLTPLFKLVGFKRGGWFWGNPQVTNLGFEDDPDPGDLDELSPSDVGA